MRQAFVLGCALLICICIAGDAQPLVALPPGTYSLQIEHQFGQWRTVAEQVEVRISELPHQ
jgi:hypothetical protein